MMQHSSKDATETVLDATGLLCPLPVLRARKKLQELPTGALLRVLASDPVSRIDMPHFCNEAGHQLMESIEAGDHLEFLICRGP
jgi:tRNA 2-thiouridine synthesizing protein A